MTPLVISVIIPTYNRKNSLLRTLDSLSRQTYPAECFEVLVVDDGGTDGTEVITQRLFPFALRYLRQDNQGDAYARNHGAQKARGDILQFLDDDIIVEPDFLTAVVAQHSLRDKQMVIARLLPLPSASPTAFQKMATAAPIEHANLSSELDFTAILSGVLSLKKEDYLSLGMMQPIAKSGSSVWCDVEFSYRAHRQGHSLWCAGGAIAYHDDYAVRDLHVACLRAQRAASVGAALFQKHPHLEAHIPMFRDKGPIAWRQDRSRLIVRKLARQVISSRPAMGSMEHAVPILERRAPESTLLALLYRWIISGYIYRGYREGLRNDC